MRDQIKELLGQGVSVFVTAGTNAARIIQEQSGTAAVVVASLDSLHTAGIASISRPAGNVTGFATLSTDLMLKRFELLGQVVPELRRIAVLWNAGSPTHPAFLANLHEAARPLGIDLRPIPVARDTDLGADLRQERANGVQAIVSLRDFFFETQRIAIVQAALRAGLPSAFDERMYVDAGGLLSYSPNHADLFRRSAEYVVRILDGAKPTDLPIQLPTEFELVINLKTVRTLGLEAPAALLLQADEVIE
jgi:putative ABC transport system substrate-binding protein